jgi:hypothetical protein
MPRATRLRTTGTTIAIGSLAVLLAAAPFLPRGGGDQGAVRPSAAGDRAALAHATAGQSAVTTTARAEIDRIVNQGLTASRTLTARATPAALVAAQIRCADFEGQRYCLHSGWTEETQSQVVAGVTAEADQISMRPAMRTTSTGDADILTTLQASARMTPTARAAAERAELTQAAKAVAKVWLIRNQIEGVPLPAGFLDRHPEVRTQLPSPQPLARSTASPTATATASPTKSTATSSPTTSTTPTSTSTSSPSVSPTNKVWKDYPASARILDKHDVAEQTRTYYCGPTSMQMIAWNWSGKEESQEHWASKLGTTSSGTSITDMVRVTNAYTGWDQDKYAGPYIVLDVKNYSYAQWMLLNMRHIVDYRAPLIFHPILLKQYYPYLDDDASGHFQVGRGYDKKGTRPNLISYFEPWNQQRFDPSEPYIARVQWRDAYKSYRANLAHFQHNIGV